MAMIKNTKFACSCVHTGLYGQSAVMQLLCTHLMSDKKQFCVVKNL